MERTGIKQPHLADFIRALRLPFISVTVLPFILGSFIVTHTPDVFRFLLGLASAIFMHLGANLINDYADSKSGVDWQDKKFYGFFGGSKLIQEGVLSEAFYLKSALFCFILSALCVFILSLSLRNFSTIGFYLIILILGASYSQKPLQLCYRRLGEAVIFILFGPALVMGAYFIQTGIFPDHKSFMLSLPFGLLTTTILFANEIPDYSLDKKCAKFNWVSFFGEAKSYIAYLILITAAFITIALSISLGYLGKLAYFSFIFILPALKAANILKKHSTKEELTHSSKLTILTHTLVSIILILDILW